MFPNAVIAEISHEFIWDILGDIPEVSHSHPRPDMNEWDTPGIYLRFRKR